MQKEHLSSYNIQIDSSAYCCSKWSS